MNERIKSTLDLSLEQLIHLYDCLNSRFNTGGVNNDSLLHSNYIANSEENDYVLYSLQQTHEVDTRFPALKAILKSRSDAGNDPDYKQVIHHDVEFQDQMQHMCKMMGLDFKVEEVELEERGGDYHFDNNTLNVVDTLMSSLGGQHTLTSIVNDINKAKIESDKHAEEVAGFKKQIQDLQKSANKPSFPQGVVATNSGSEKTSTPVSEADAEIVMKNAMDIFTNSEGKKVKALDYDIPTFKWKKPNPDVPELDPTYVFRPELVSDVLYCLLHNQKGYLSGHTGTGKTTLIEQVCAKLGYPFKRINFDSEITRMDLVGREVLMEEKGTTKSKFIDGIIPTAVRTPTVLCLDEIDFVRPDVAYVLQRALENKGFTILEDGDRFVEPHPLFRIFATANTKGQGDETGSYQGARHQSLAFLDRFNVFTSVPYLRPHDEAKILVEHATGLDSKLADQMVKFANEIRDAFKNGTIYMTTSIRGLMTCAKMYTFFLPMMSGNHNAALTFAITKSILNRCGHQDFANISEIAQRVFDTGSGTPLNFKYED